MKLVIDIPDGDYRYIKELQSLIIARGTCKTIQRDVINAIKNGTPYEERPKGKWIEYDDDELYAGECACCKWKAVLYEGNVLNMNFCPNCGADMRGDV